MKRLRTKTSDATPGIYCRLTESLDQDVRMIQSETARFIENNNLPATPPTLTDVISNLVKRGVTQYKAERRNQQH